MTVRKDSGASTRLALFEDLILPHLDSAYNLARWLLRNEQDAQDAVQESYLRAFRFFDGYHGGDGKAWLLAIVRNTCRTWRQREHGAAAVPFDEAVHGGEDREPDPQQAAASQERIARLRTCIDRLPVEFREVLVMRELEEMSYREIADTTRLALGTVMSRLSRARRRLEECASRRANGARP